MGVVCLSFVELEKKIRELNKLIIQKEDTKLVEFDIYKLSLGLVFQSIIPPESYVEEVLRIMRNIDDLEIRTVYKMFSIVRDILLSYYSVRIAEKFEELIKEVKGGSLTEYEFVRMSARRTAELIAELERKLESIQDESEKKELQKLINELKDDLVKQVLYE
jgi:hypothetical protein